MIIPSKPETWNSRSLAQYLHDEVVTNFFGKGPGQVPIEPVAGNLSQWIHKDGIKPETVKAMIDHFVSDPQNLIKGVPAWKSFVNLRQRLYETVERQEEAVQARTGGEEYWFQGIAPRHWSSERQKRLETSASAASPSR